MTAKVSTLLHITELSVTLSHIMNSVTRNAIPQIVVSPGLRGAWGIITHRHFSPFKMFIAREHRTVVVLNPKVGSTSFRHVLQRAYREILGRKHMSNSCYRLFKKARDFPFSPPCDYLHAFSHPEEYTFYCFVRNPYARLKSAWNDKLAWGHESEYPPSVRGEVISHIRRFAADHDLPGQENGTGIPFSTFVAYVSTQETGKQNHHWDEQYSVLLMNRIQYSQIFKMESQFVDGTKVVLAQIGIPESWTEGALANPFNESRKATEQLYTPDLAAKVQFAFARDFSTLGYEVDSWKGI